METLAKCGRIAASVGGLKLEAHGVTVVIRHAQRDDIKVSATSPHNWVVDNDGVIRQRNAAEVLGGAIEITTSQIGSKPTISGVTVKGDLAIVDDRVYVNGQQVSPDVLHDNPARKESDRLELLVPEPFRGGLDITFSAGTVLDIDAWTGGDVSLAGSAGSTVAIGTLADLDSFVLNGRGFGGANIESIRAGKFSATKQGFGDLKIGALVVDSFQLSQSGIGNTHIGSLNTQAGIVVQRGGGVVDISEASAHEFQVNQVGAGTTRVGEMETAAFTAVKEGGGNLAVGGLVTESLQVSQSGMGNTCIDGGSAESGRVQTEGVGNITLRGRFGSISRRSSGIGQVRIQDSV